MKHFLGWMVALWLIAVGAEALPQQSLLSTLTEDTSPTQSLIDRYEAPRANNTTPQQTFFDNYQSPTSSRVSFGTPSGLYRHLCTSCLYDTKTLQCICQDLSGQDPITTAMTAGDCQNFTVDTTGRLMCLDHWVPAKS